LGEISGKVIISELNRKNLFVRLYVKIMMPHENIESHFSKGEVLEMLDFAGLKIEKSYTQSLFGVPFSFNWFIVRKF
jgi:hypothetical protein